MSLSPVSPIVAGLCLAASLAAQTTVVVQPFVPRLPDAVLVEGQAWSLALDFVPPTARVHVTGLPPGARFDELTRTLAFRPDSIQGGNAWSVGVHVDSAGRKVDVTFRVRVLDTITPPDPVFVQTIPMGAATVEEVSQTTDTWLDSPGYAGRSFSAFIGVPPGLAPGDLRPLVVILHESGGKAVPTVETGVFVLAPDDSVQRTGWYGYGDSLPLPGGAAPTSGTVPPYTQRRMRHLIEWVLERHPNIDPERVFVEGGSMGGFGAMQLGFSSARHFAGVRCTAGAANARRVPFDRLLSFIKLFGQPVLNLDDGMGLGVWDRLDLTRALRDEPEARAQYLWIRHGKDDSVVPYALLFTPSVLTGLGWVDALRTHRVGNYFVWDEGAHGNEGLGGADPLLSTGWWDNDWDPKSDLVTYLRRDLAFPAFANASIDRDPGTGTGTTGDPFVAGDNGLDGEIAGARNRFLRWDAATIVDTFERFEVDLFVLNGTGGAAPAAGYPTTGDLFDRTLPSIVDVTVRRAQGFVAMAGEPLNWTFGVQGGAVNAGPDGAVTVPGLLMTHAATRLVVTR